MTLLAPCLPLRFLVRPERRAKKPSGMEGFSESACFHRLFDLFWTFRDVPAVALLSDEERSVSSSLSSCIGSATPLPT